MSITIKPTRSAIAIAGVAFAAALSGCGSSSTTNTASAGNGNQQGGPQGTTPGGRRGGFGMANLDTAALAKTLGVSETKLKAAIQAATPNFGNRQGGGQGGPPNGTTPPQGGAPGGAGGTTPGRDPAQFQQMQTQRYAAIAKSLGLSESKVQKAFEALMPAGGPPNGAPGATTPAGAAS
ncbi:MAG: hypothetical protein AAGC46_11675 [Solirubrobacteraceae bacterium]|nr:hypothetical protein [Patulibacter sp.]